MEESSALTEDYRQLSNGELAIAGVAIAVISMILEFIAYISLSQGWLISQYQDSLKAYYKIASIDQRKVEFYYNKIWVLNSHLKGTFLLVAGLWWSVAVISVWFGHNFKQISFEKNLTGWNIYKLVIYCNIVSWIEHKVPKLQRKLFKWVNFLS